MTGRAPGPGYSSSPMETAAIALLIAGMGGTFLLWACGIVVGSILGASLPGSGTESVGHLLRAFPSVGLAWEPPIPSWAVWTTATVLVAVFTPLVWRLLHAGRPHTGGAEWATTNELRNAGLLIVDHRVPHAQLEETESGQG